MTTTILLVDNDPLQAYICKALLERSFVGVKRVPEAAEALCLVEQPQFAGDLALVITRDHLPGIGGPAFVEELHTRLPDLPVLVLGEDGHWTAPSKGARVRFLPRTAAEDEIISAVDELLAKTGRSKEIKVA